MSGCIGNLICITQMKRSSHALILFKFLADESRLNDSVDLMTEICSIRELKQLRRRIQRQRKKQNKTKQNETIGFMNKKNCSALKTH